AEMVLGELSNRVRSGVDKQRIKTVVIDSINGYKATTTAENALVLQLHELLLYLHRQGAATFMTVAQHGLVGDMQPPVEITSLPDTVVLLRYFEALRKVRRAISIIKKRTGRLESTIREYRISGRGLPIGAPLESFQGVLRGVPSYQGESKPLLQD
ncbi:circadian clock protein KaiC, partial [Pseudomonas sp. MWU12-2534b]